jgi:hypothetical protein
MLETIIPVRYHSPVGSGKTKPCRIECEKADGSLVEVVAKFSGGCERKETALAMEVIAACLAGDLGLPIPKPYLVDVSADFIATVPVASQQQLMAASSKIAFASTHLGTGYRAWSIADTISPAVRPDALAIFCFDGFICNADRRVDNPNCLVRGALIRIIDHELAFVHKMLIGQKQPWQLGGLAPLATPGQHIFYAGLKGQDLDLDPVQRSWSAVTDDRLDEYKMSIPQQWIAGTALDDAVSLIQGVRGNIAAAIAEVGRVLK